MKVIKIKIDKCSDCPYYQYDENNTHMECVVNLENEPEQKAHIEYVIEKYCPLTEIKNEQL